MTKKAKAHYLVTQAVSSGVLVRPSNCSDCGRGRYCVAHHDDYSKPLGVRWLCQSCHAGFHWWLIRTGQRTTSAERTAARLDWKKKGVFLKNLRTSKGIFMGWVAGKMKVSPSVLSVMEKGGLPWNPKQTRSFLKAVCEL